MATTIVHRVRLPANPREVYDVLLDPERHGEAVGTKVWISKHRGGKFSAGDGSQWGEILDLVPGRRIVQTWRSSAWRERDEDSVVILTLERVKEGSDLTILQAQVPNDLAAAVKEEWEERYGERLRSYLQARKAKAPLVAEP